MRQIKHIRLYTLIKVIPVTEASYYQIQVGSTDKEATLNKAYPTYRCTKTQNSFSKSRFIIMLYNLLLAKNKNTSK